MRSLLMVTGAVLAAGFTIAAIGASGKRPSDLNVLRFQGTGATSTFVDNGPAGGSPGDMIVVHEQLQRNERTVGRVDTFCVLTEPPRARCQATAVIPGGQLSTEGILLNPTQPHKEGITGGTGRFRRARGTAQITPGSGGDDVTFRVFLK
jgi:hypothetical protein